MKLNLAEAALWSAEETASLLSHGYVPIITVGCKFGDDEGEIRFAVSCARGLDDAMIVRIFEDLVAQHRDGSTRWVTNCPEHGDHDTSPDGWVER